MPFDADQMMRMELSVTTAGQIVRKYWSLSLTRITNLPSLYSARSLRPTRLNLFLQSSVGVSNLCPQASSAICQDLAKHLRYLPLSSPSYIRRICALFLLFAAEKVTILPT